MFYGFWHQQVLWDCLLVWQFVPWICSKSLWKYVLFFWRSTCKKRLKAFVNFWVIFWYSLVPPLKTNGFVMFLYTYTYVHMYHIHTYIYIYIYIYIHIHIYRYIIYVMCIFVCLYILHLLHYVVLYIVSSYHIKISFIFRSIARSF